MKAFVDSREPSSLKEVCGFEQQELAQGDFYLPEHDVVIERKEASDFASSTTDGRLSEQADRMVAEHDHVFVVIENPVETYFDGDNYQIDSLYGPRYSHINRNSITGMQTSLAVKRGVKIIYTESMEDTLYAVRRIFERFADKEHEQAAEGYVKTADTGEVEDVQVAMLAQIEGVSLQKAKAINRAISLDKLSWHVSCERGDTQGAKDAIMSVDGVGGVLAQRVIDAFQ